MALRITETTLTDILILEPDCWADDRGFFMESWNESVFNKTIGRTIHFVQDNHSLSHRGVVRGLHYQLPPFAQAKLVRCVQGETFDVAVDIRRSSPTFGQWVGVMLSAQNRRQLWIPEGFAHGFMALSDSVELLYKTNRPWDRASERTIRWDDPDLAIGWPDMAKVQLSEKDLQGKRFIDADLFP